MIFISHIPESPLDTCVQQIVYYRDYQPEHEKDKFVPDGTTNLIIDLRESPKYIYDNSSLIKKQECSKTWFSGMHTEYLTISSGVDSEMMVITFKPGGVFQFVNTSLAAFTNKVVAANEIFGQAILQVREEMKLETVPEQKIKIAECWLMNCLGKVTFTGQLVQHFVSRILEEPACIDLKSMARKSGYSQKQFIFLFKKHVGLTPKQLHRIVRFNEILAGIHNKLKVDWPSVFTDCGYYDQAHFIKDFQSFSGINPQKYLEEQGEWPHYIPIR